MASVFRSQEMCLCQLIIPSDSAFKCVAEIGEIEVVHFNDLNTHQNAFAKKFVNEIRRCNEIERKLRFIEKELSKDNMPPVSMSEEPGPLKSDDLLQLESVVEKIQEELLEVNESTRGLMKSKCELVELKHVLNTVHMYLDQGIPDALPPSEETSTGDERQDSSQKLTLSEDRSRTMSIGQAANVRFMAGVILTRKLSSFELTIWRTSRGNAFLRQSPIKDPIEDPLTGAEEQKVVFLIFFQGEKLRSKIEKICEGFQATLYSCPDNVAAINRLLSEVSTRQVDVTTVLSSTQDHRRNLLMSAAEQVNACLTQVLKTKAVYNTLNMCSTDVAKQSLLAECWIPVSELGLVKMALKAGTKDSGSDVSAILNRKTTNAEPPTSFKVNKLTSGFQALCDAYGIASYQEMSPVPFSVISFPFLFSVMFGDFGHAFIMFLIGSWMCIWERKLSKKWESNEVWQIIFSGRYIVLLMGVFSIYTGFMYNDGVSKSVDIFGTQWRVNFDFEYLSRTPLVDLEPDPFNRANRSDWKQMYSGNPYLFGVDPVWALSLNKITFLNSMKMKLSIVLGVTQMVLGLLLSLTNIMYFKRKMDIPFEFVPKIVFFICMFGYLLVLIFYKWIRYNGSSDPQYGANCAPALLVQYINMFLFTYDQSDCTTALFYPGQKAVQVTLVVIAIACVPLMLIPKPVIAIRSKKKRSRSFYSRSDSLAASLIDMAGESGSDEHSHLPEFAGESKESPAELSTADILMDHTIETIEFFLNSISSAASYLRLWALSLAHAELSDVLWKMLMHLGFVISDKMALKAIFVFIIFYAWAVLTFSILIVMEGLSAFLHVLRLHWVEFQGKFYGGTGKEFTPLRLKGILSRTTTAAA